ncbi:DUF6228 family protein [Pseudomonas resinovorans]|uniref:DUF6228 family protein n=1 Tax=Metapseudomonas resinovorans TaxID=53412 RepID=UPI00237FAF7D|nr:DUF6228 family protein [Pseudomonas resinovorans]MDE3738588.1 DUF6228 family protein [Pseudomonas resinovorans]
MLALHSVASDQQLRLHSLQDDEFILELAGNGLTASQRIYAGPDGNPPQYFFQELGAMLAPWTEPLVYESLDHDLTMIATCSALGIVTLQIEMRPNEGANDAWTLHTSIQLKLGKLPDIGRAAREFFQSCPGKGTDFLSLL